MDTSTSNVKDLDSISESLSEISHRIRSLHPANCQSALEISIQLYELSVRVKSIARELEDDGM